MASVAEVLEKAADLIEPEGRWTRWQYGRFPGGREWDVDDGYFADADLSCFCIYGAVAYAAGAACPEDYRAADRILLDVVDGANVWAVAVWNDAAERTQAEVVAKLREAAALARERGL